MFDHFVGLALKGLNSTETHQLICCANELTSLKLIFTTYQKLTRTPLTHFVLSQVKIKLQH